MSGTVRLERKGDIGWIVLDRPEARNALTVPMRAEAVAVIEEADRDDGLTAIAITGAGDHFCGGGDIASMPAVRDAWEGRERTSTAQRVVQAVLSTRKPTVAVARGAVAGLGVSVFAACDVRLAAEGARFQAGFGAVGLIPDGGIMHLLPRLVGWGRAREWMMLNRPLEASDARSWGLVSYVVDDRRLEQLAEEVVADLAKLPPRALALTKQGLRLAAESSWEATLEFERTAQGGLIVDPEARRRVERFLDRGGRST